MLLAFCHPSQEAEFLKKETEKGKWEKTVALNNKKMLEKKNNKAIFV